MSFIVVAVAVLVAGLVLLRLGLLGRTIDDHPVCGNCGRDLFGLDPLPPKCPECGEKTIGNVRRGNRGRRPKLCYAGGALVTLALLALAPVLSSTLLVGEFQQYKPFWLLAWESRTSVSAANEIERRQIDGELTADQVDDILARWLDHQGDPNLPWITTKGDLLDHAAKIGLLTPAQTQRFVEQAVLPVIEVRRRARSGGELPVWIGGEMRGLSPPPGQQGMIPWPSEIPVVLSLVRDGRRYAGRFEEVGATPGGTALKWISLAEVQPGTYGFAIEYRPGGRVGLPALLNDPRPVPPPVFEVEVTPADEPTAVILDVPHELERVRRAVRLVDASYSRTPGDGPQVLLLRYEANRHMEAHAEWHLLIDLKDLRSLDPPMKHDLAYTVLLLDPVDGREWGRGDLSIRGGSRGTSGQGFNGSLPMEFDGDTLDVILRPSVEVAETTPFATRILGGDLVFEVVPVVWDAE